MRMQVKLEIGHKAASREQVTHEGFTHDWTVFVRGLDDKDISHFVEKVIFYLHESFPRPKRVVKEPPFKLDEHGYGSFELRIDVCFKTKDEPRRVTFTYDLFLPLLGYPPVTNVRTEALTFTYPSEDFTKKLLKGGGIQMPIDSASGHSNGIHNGHGKDDVKGITQKSVNVVESDKSKKKLPKPSSKPAPVVGMKRSPSSHDDPPADLLSTKKKRKLSESTVVGSGKNKVSTKDITTGNSTTTTTTTNQPITTEVKDLRIKFKPIPPREEHKPEQTDDSQKQKSHHNATEIKTDHDGDKQTKHTPSEHKVKLKKKGEKVSKKHGEKKEKREKKDKVKKEKDGHKKEKKIKERNVKMKEPEEMKVVELQEKKIDKIEQDQEKPMKVEEPAVTDKGKNVKEDKETTVKEVGGSNETELKGKMKEKEDKVQKQKHKKEDKKSKDRKGNEKHDSKNKEGKEKKSGKGVEKVTIRRSSGDSWASSGSSCGLMANVVSKNKALGKLLSELSEDEEEDGNLSTPFKREASPPLSAVFGDATGSLHLTTSHTEHTKSHDQGGEHMNHVQLHDTVTKDRLNSVIENHENTGTQDVVDGRASSPAFSEKNGLNKISKKELYDLFEQINKCRDSTNLQKVVDVIETTGLYTVSEKTLEFDLCSLEKSTLRKIQKCLGLR